MDVFTYIPNKAIFVGNKIFEHFSEMLFEFFKNHPLHSNYSETLNKEYIGRIYQMSS